MTTPKPCESGACIHVHEEGGIVHIRSTETGDSMTATPAEWAAYLDAATRNARLEATQAVDREWCRNVDLATDRPDGQPFFEAVAEAIRAQHRDRIAELELANKTLEIALKHVDDLNGTLMLQRNQVLNLISDDQVADVPYWLRKDIRNIYVGKEQK